MSSLTNTNKICHAAGKRAIAGLLALFFFIIMPLAACTGPFSGSTSPAQTPTPTSSSPFQLKTVDLGIPQAVLNSPVVGQLPDTTQLHVRVTFKINPALLKQAEEQKIQPGQRSHVEDLAHKIGISDATYQKIKSFFNLQGISLKLSKLRTNLSIEAKAGTIGKVLHTKFVIHKYNGTTFYAPESQVKLPAFFADSIESLTGLDNYSARPTHAFTMYPTSSNVFHSRTAVSSSAAKHRPSQDCNPVDQTLLPKDIARAYGYDALWGRGLHGENMTVNLVEIDGFDANDVNNYLACINFQGKVSVADVDSAPRQALGESTLDVQMVAGLARSINIVDYETDGNANDDIWVSINDELQQIINDNTQNANAGSVVSISLGAAEQEISSADIRAIDSSIQQLTRVEHMTVFAASGDCGAFTSGHYGNLSVSFPASDPWVVSVGGTILTINNNQNRNREFAWSDGSNLSSCKNRWGTGGGNSVVFQRPQWQNAPGVNNSYSRNARQLPDVSAAAFALAVYYQGQWGSVGGTSAAAPIWAAGLSLVNEGMMRQANTYSFSPQLFYAVANKAGGLHPYYDVTQGNNLYYRAAPGWDYTTGLGTPNLQDFYQTL